MMSDIDKTLSLGYSTCPNDTFIFYALAHNIIDCGGYTFKTSLTDVEKLNQAAKMKKYDISKLSFAAIGHLQNTYSLLRSGAALGRGCGPLIISRPGFSLNQMKSKTIAVPGLWTTACMLLGLYIEDMPDIVPMPFDRIMPAVKNKTFDFGVIIHEGRFTYQEYGLTCLLDLGKWWEETTSLPIPLGGIAIRKEIPLKIAQQVEIMIKRSVEYAFKNKNTPDDYIIRHAQELSPSVIRQHIDLYVNDFTINLGPEGEKAIERLFSMGRDFGILPKCDEPLFLSC